MAQPSTHLCEHELKKLSVWSRGGAREMRQPGRTGGLSGRVFKVKRRRGSFLGCRWTGCWGHRLVSSSMNVLSFNSVPLLDAVPLTTQYILQSQAVNLSRKI